MLSHLIRFSGCVWVALFLSLFKHLPVRVAFLPFLSVSVFLRALEVGRTLFILLTNELDCVVRWARKNEDKNDGVMEYLNLFAS